MKRILILSNEHFSTYNLRKEVVEGLLKEGHEVFISFPYGSKADDFFEMGAKFIDVEIDRRGTNPIKDLKLLKQYKKIMKEIKPDVVLTYTIKPNIYGGMAAKSLKIPYIANITGLGSAVENKGILQKVTVFLYKKAFSKINTVFFQNEENMSFFIKNKIALGKHELLPGSGVNLDKFKLLPYPDDDKIKFVFVSRIMKEKGIDYYLETAKAIKTKYLNTEFHICGSMEENYKDKIESYSKDNIVIYHGLVNDIREVLKNMNAIIHPTYYPEGISNVILEAAATGRPAIAFNRSGCKEIIDNDLTGYLVETHDIKTLISKVEEFVNLPLSNKIKMGILARNKVEKEFNREIVVNKYMEIIDNIEEMR